MTPGNLIKDNKNGTYTVTSIRSDGYLFGLGAILFKYYTEPNKVDGLFKLGWITWLEQELIDCPPDETFNGEYPKLHSSLQDAIQNSCLGANYLWKDNKWYYAEAEFGDYETGFPLLQMPDFQEITRELLISVYPQIQEFLDDTEKMLTIKEKFPSL